MKNALKILSLVIGMTITAPILMSASEIGTTADDVWYVCFQSENYVKKNKNKMVGTKLTDTPEEYEFKLSNVSLDITNGFKVMNDSGMIYASTTGNDVKVDSTISKSYDILFSPDFIYNDTYATTANGKKQTDCHISYRNYNPSKYTVSLDGGTTFNYDLIYNAEASDLYELYYLDDKNSLHDSNETYCVDFSGIPNDVIKLKKDGVDTEAKASTTEITNTIQARILYTPKKTIDGNDYMFNINGEWGTGTGYEYNFYVEEVTKYAIAFKSEDLTKISFNGDEGDNRKLTATGLPDNSYPLCRNEEKPNQKDYASLQFFTKANNTELKYEIYVYDVSQSKYVIIPDSSGSTYLTKTSIEDIDWYKFHLYENNGVYTSNVKEYNNRSSSDNYYLAGSFNNNLYDTTSGTFTPNDTFKFNVVETTDSMYNENYDQYLFELNLTREGISTDPTYPKLVNNSCKFFITNGKEKYKDGDDYIEITEVGKYKIYFSPNLIYGRNRRYVVKKVVEENQSETIWINSIEDYQAFVSNCQNTKYSINKRFELTTDLDFEGIEINPIKEFSGEFYGNYHTISNVSLSNDITHDKFGIFEVVNPSASIKSLTFKNINFDLSETSNLGVVSYNYGLLENITVEGYIKGKSYIGSIAGNNDKKEVSGVTYTGTIKNCLNLCSVEGKEVVGGICGRNKASIISCKNKGGINNVSYSTNNIIQNIGGICGLGIGSFVDCSNEGEIGYLETGSNIGGIIGQGAGDISFCKNYGEIFGSTFTGGICGFFGNPSSLTNNNYNYGIPDITSYINEYTGNNSSVRTDDQEYKVSDSDAANLKVVYLVNKGNVTSTNTAGGLFGQIAMPVKLKNSISKGNIKVNNGSNAGGIVGTLSTSQTGTSGTTITTGSIISCMATGTIEANGTISGSYVGGIVGSLTGSVTDCVSTCTIVGNEYVGGVVGKSEYLENVSPSIIKRTYANTAIVSKKETTQYVGSIAGDIATANTSTSIDKTHIHFNYFVSENLYGIAKKNYDQDDIAKRLEMGELKCKDSLPVKADLNNADGDADYVAKFYGGVGDYSYPTLRFLEERDTNYDANFTLNNDSTNTFEYYFSNIRDEILEIHHQYTKISVDIIYREYDDSLGDIDENGVVEDKAYKITSISQWFYGEKIKENPQFIYAEETNGKYIYKGKENTYFVYWPSFDTTKFENIHVDAKYVTIEQALKFKDDNFDVLVGGDFMKGTELKVQKNGKYIELHFIYNGQEVYYDNIIVQIKTSKKNKVFVVKDGVETSIESEFASGYTKFTLEKGSYLFSIEEDKFTLPWWAIMLISIGGTAILTTGTILIILAVRKKKATNPKSNSHKKDKAARKTLKKQNKLDKKSKTKKKKEKESHKKLRNKKRRR